MIVDIYQYFKEHPSFNKLVGDNFIFVEYKCPIDIEEFQLWTESHIITYVVSGKKDWITPNKTYELLAGDAIFVRKGVYVTKQYFEEDYCVMLFLINDDFIKKFMSENNLSPGGSVQGREFEPVFRIDTSDSFQSLIESIFHYLKQGESLPERLVTIKFKELLFNIALNPKNRQLLQYFGSIQQRAKVDMEDTMLQNFQYDLSMEGFAKLCGRSLSTFKRDFKNRFNSTPSKWLNEKRLEYAKALLLGSDLSISEVCYESGFKNTSHFNRIFKDKYRLPPNQFKMSQNLS
ncbi:AraC family transcriptional regulator [Flavobacteriaceae bacterium 3-367]|uniref:helix-turn-helix domain-containing protein n=1 Tax=Eudoraea algarum TaxID=3417568 RepID=UPI003275D1B7